MSALVVMLLLAFLLVIAASLTIWSALTLNDPRTLPVPVEPEPELSATPARPRPTNDEVRGARAARVTQREDTSRERASNDAFERFLTSDARRDESEF